MLNKTFINPSNFLSSDHNFEHDFADINIDLL